MLGEALLTADGSDTRKNREKVYLFPLAESDTCGSPLLLNHLYVYIFFTFSICILYTHISKFDVTSSEFSTMITSSILNTTTTNKKKAINPCLYYYKYMTNIIPYNYINIHQNSMHSFLNDESE